MSEFVSGLIAFIVFALLIGGIALFFKALSYFERMNQRNAADRATWEQKIESDRLAFVERHSARYILTHNPSRYQVENILNSPATPEDRELAIRTALDSGDIRLIGLIQTYAPEFGREAMLAYYSAQFDQDDGRNSRTALDDFRDWELLDGTEGDWWRKWKPKLEAKATLYQARLVLEAEQAEAARYNPPEEEDSSSNWDDDDDGDDYWDYR